MVDESELSRRELLTILGGAACIPLASACSAPPTETPAATSAAAKPQWTELDFSSALDAADAIRQKKVSSVELTQRAFERIDRFNPQLNAFTYQLRDEAVAQAKSADEKQARGESLGVFHGVPVHVKESFAIAGRPCTWGLAAFRDSKAPRNAAVVDRLIGAGAVLIGSTNVPVDLADWQSYNPIYGTTNNPWDVKRTPGGSSGGTAAALAVLFFFLRFVDEFVEQVDDSILPASNHIAAIAVAKLAGTERHQVHDLADPLGLTIGQFQEHLLGSDPQALRGIRVILEKGRERRAGLEKRGAAGADPDHSRRPPGDKRGEEEGCDDQERADHLSHVDSLVAH